MLLLSCSYISHFGSFPSLRFQIFVLFCRTSISFNLSFPHFIFVFMYFTSPVYASRFSLSFSFPSHHYINSVYTAVFLSWSLLFKPFSLQLHFCYHFFAHFIYQSFHPTHQSIRHPSFIQSVSQKLNYYIISSHYFLKILTSIFLIFRFSFKLSCLFW